MPQYIQVHFTSVSVETSSILVALLSDIGYEGFEEGDNQLKAFIPEKSYDAGALEELIQPMDISYGVKQIPEQNWNAVWEAGFDPVTVDDFVSVRAGFHAPVKGVQHEIVITPKMSFGTGHHATTWLMMDAMRDIPFNGKRVFDFGAGTGILSILAEQLGALEVYALDNDSWSHENSLENSDRNDCHRISWHLGDKPPSDQEFDIIIANINRHVILQFLPQLQTIVVSGGIILLSGLLVEDEAVVKEAAMHSGLIFNEKKERNGWISLKFVR